MCIAIGQTQKQIPDWAEPFFLSPDSEISSRILHADQLDLDTIEKERRLDGKRLLVVGEGLTSGQLAVGAAKMVGCQEVVLVARKPMKVQAVEVALPWLGKFKNKHMAQFYAADNEGNSFLLFTFL